MYAVPDQRQPPQHSTVPSDQAAEHIRQAEEWLAAYEKGVDNGDGTKRHPVEWQRIAVAHAAIARALRTQPSR